MTTERVPSTKTGISYNDGEQDGLTDLIVSIEDQAREQGRREERTRLIGRLRHGVEESYAAHGCLGDCDVHQYALAILDAEAAR